jgi:hypothetical protein
LINCHHFNEQDVRILLVFFVKKGDMVEWLYSSLQNYARRFKSCYHLYTKIYMKNTVPLRAQKNDLFLAAPRTPFTALSYRGGHIVENPEVFTIYVGNSWATAPKKKMKKLYQLFFEKLVVSEMMDQLAEFNTEEYKIGKGKLIGSYTIEHPTSKNLSDYNIRQALQYAFAKKIIPPPNPQRIFFIFLEKGMVISKDNSASCSEFCGYHNFMDTANGQAYYAVIPYHDCGGCTSEELNSFDAACVTAAHELAEVVTDPVPGGSWYNDMFGEVGDYPDGLLKKIKAGYYIQTLFSNNLLRSV